MSFVGTELKFVGCREPFVEYIIADSPAKAMKATIGHNLWGFSLANQRLGLRTGAGVISGAAGTRPGSTVARFFPVPFG